MCKAAGTQCCAPTSMLAILLTAAAHGMPSSSSPPDEHMAGLEHTRPQLLHQQVLVCKRQGRCRHEMANASCQPVSSTANCCSLASQHRSWSLRRRILLACDAQHVSKILSLWGGPALAQAGAVAEESLQLSQLSLQGSSGGVGLGEVGSLAGMMASMRHCGGRGALIQCCSRSVQLQPPRRHPTLASAVGHCSAARLAPNTCPCRAMSASGCSSGSCMAARPCRCGCVKQVHERHRALPISHQDQI